MPKVSVVVPIYGVEDYLPKCVQAILDQTFTDYECILVDDGGKDNCPALCDEYALQDERFKVLHKPNGGLSDARNKGMEIATGEYIYFPDSDDFIEPDCLEKCVNALDEHQADMVIFDVYQYYMMKGTRELIHQDLPVGRVFDLDSDPSCMTKMLNAAWNKMYRRSLFTEHNIEYPKGFLYEDLGCTYRLLLECKKVVFIDVPLYNYLVDRPGNITTQFNERIMHVLDMMQINIDAFKAKGVYEKYYEELKYLAGVNIMECLKKTRDVVYDDLVKRFVDKAFAFLKENFPDFPKGKYEMLRQKNDWIYANKFVLKLYLTYKQLRRK